jgi:AcrR family transcriptional regulator
VKVRTEARRDLILDTAAEVFRELGFEGTTMTEITKRLGGSKATVYGYFPSKEALFLAVVQAEALRRLHAAVNVVAAHHGPSLRDDLIQFGTALVGFNSSAVGTAALRMVMAQAGRSDIGELFYKQGPAQGLLLLAGALRAAMDRGELREADPLTAAQHFEGLLTSETNPRLFQQNPAPVTERQASLIAERAANAFLNGYVSPR